MSPSKYDLERKYGLTPEQVQKMFVRQKGKCPICTRPIYQAGATHRRASPIEHDHKTGRVRGIACYVCNRYRIGRNTLETAKRLVKYLESEFDGRKL